MTKWVIELDERLLDAVKYYFSYGSHHTTDTGIIYNALCNATLLADEPDSPTPPQFSADEVEKLTACQRDIQLAGEAISELLQQTEKRQGIHVTALFALNECLLHRADLCLDILEGHIENETEKPLETNPKTWPCSNNDCGGTIYWQIMEYGDSGRCQRCGYQYTWQHLPSPPS